MMKTGCCAQYGECQSGWPFFSVAGVVRGLAILDGEGVKLTFADSIINLQRHDPP